MYGFSFLPVRLYNGNNMEGAVIMRELCFEKDGMKIYGHLHLPEGKGPFPCVIICHGYGASLEDHEYYAECMEKEGIAAYCFDFIGGGPEVKSEGTMREMSVLSETEDLLAVMDAVRELEETDENNLFLMGGSQGGFVITEAAHRRPGQVRGLIPLYPAYVIYDYVKRIVPDMENIPETLTVLGMETGCRYAKDALSFDIYDHMDYPGPVMIIHGTADELVPLSYSEKALGIFENASLVRISGAGHGFYNDDEKRVARLAIEFVRKHTRQP